MLFNSLDFAIFFPIVFILYWIVSRNRNARNFLIILASYVFYGWWDWRFLFLIAISSFVDFYVGKKLGKAEDIKRRKLLLSLSLFINLGFLVYYKYTNFFIETFVDSFKLFGKTLEVSTLNIILPVGISFYTFQTLSYTIDIYRKQLKPTNDPLAFFAFVSFFPQLVAGPIERASHLLPQFYKTYRFNYNQVKSGILLMVFGLFKKMVIADRVAILVNQVYNNPEAYHGFEVVIATILFAFQIYCDFSGYSDIAIGAGRTMGFDLMKNFRSPYLSKSITEFWRRWHISLSTWFRDYVYIPLGGSRNGNIKTYFNLLIVFLVSGFWHGASMTFVIWGVIHGIIIVAEKALTVQRLKFSIIFKIRRRSLTRKLFYISITYTVVCFAWIFFRSNSLKDSIVLIENMSNFKSSQILNLYNLGLGAQELWTAIIAIILLMVFEWFHYNSDKSLSKILPDQPLFFRWSFYMIIVFALMIFGVYGDMAPKEFIYFQF
ncbi:MBOAT family protein [Mangrovimonas sp. TPBH4]|uniref:MBOAT family O-acyltransferase n=1 Tax=Mangrovimonas sp. TPBH4 TaxID=1645914 RepID=UPI0006B6170A|nr:MBOAT family O-acyltransferase [Mangrovimonas sp. TPBH4]